MNISNFTAGLRNALYRLLFVTHNGHPSVDFRLIDWNTRKGYVSDGLACSQIEIMPEYQTTLPKSRYYCYRDVP